MQKNTSGNYYLGLDIGTNSVGWAVTDKRYDILKFHGKPAWGVTVFDEAKLSAERRAFRTARRRLDRRQQRVELVREIFAGEINKIDPRFFIRLQESYKYRDEAGEAHTLFNDENYTDKEYYEQYPTIHHLIKDLMDNDTPHDARLVYIACAWLVAHRGHFLSNIDLNNLSEITDFKSVYKELITFFSSSGYEEPWKEPDLIALSEALKKKTGVIAKTGELKTILLGDKKPSKEYSEEFPYNRELIVKLLAGGTVSLKDLFFNTLIQAQSA